MAEFNRSPMDLFQTIDQGKFKPARQMLSDEGGTFMVIRFKTHLEAFNVVFEDSWGNHQRYSMNQTKCMSLRP
jgi:hypothetical protein